VARALKGIAVPVNEIAAAMRGEQYTANDVALALRLSGFKADEVGQALAEAQFEQGDIPNALAFGPRHPSRHPEHLFDDVERDDGRWLHAHVVLPHALRGGWRPTLYVV
jgi:hypothetical protein